MSAELGALGVPAAWVTSENVQERLLCEERASILHFSIDDLNLKSLLIPIYVFSVRDFDNMHNKLIIFNRV